MDLVNFLFDNQRTIHLQILKNEKRKKERKKEGRNAQKNRKEKDRRKTIGKCCGPLKSSKE